MPYPDLLVVKDPDEFKCPHCGQGYWNMKRQTGICLTCRKPVKKEEWVSQ